MQVSDAVLCLQEALVVVKEVVAHLLADVLTPLFQLVQCDHKLTIILFIHYRPLVILKVEILTAKLLHKWILSLNFLYHTFTSRLLCWMSPFSCVNSIRTFHLNY